MSQETLDLLTLEPGARLRMADGATVEIVENPRDGMWVFGRYLTHPTDASKVSDAEHAIFAQDIVGFAY